MGQDIIYETRHNAACQPLNAVTIVIRKCQLECRTLNLVLAREGNWTFWVFAWCYTRNNNNRKVQFVVLVKPAIQPQIKKLIVVTENKIGVSCYYTNSLFCLRNSPKCSSQMPKSPRFHQSLFGGAIETTTVRPPPDWKSIGIGLSTPATLNLLGTIHQKRWLFHSFVIVVDINMISIISFISPSKFPFVVIPTTLFDLVPIVPSLLSVIVVPSKFDIRFVPFVRPEMVTLV